MTLRVEVKDGNVNKALSIFKSLVIKEGVFKDYKKHKEYLKPSIAKRIKSEEAERQRIKDIKKEIRQIEREESLRWD